jgi:curved DNA-binding protein CbpA
MPHTGVSGPLSRGPLVTSQEVTTMNDTQQPRDLYELLGVAPDAPAEEITRAWHRRARALHPDAQPGHAGEPARFQELAAAYRVLRDPALRAAYDRALRPPAPAAAWPAAPRWPGSILPGATVQAGPAWVIPPPGTVVAGEQAGARLAALAVLLARRLGAAPGGDWPW